MTTTPWAADTATLLAGNLTHLARARVITADGDELDLEVLDGYLDYDDTRAPRVEAALVCHLVDDAALVGRIDPRTGARVEIELGYLRPGDVEDVHQVVDLGLRDRDEAAPADELTLALAGDEALIVDNAASASLTVSTATTWEAVAAVIATCLPSASVTHSVTTPGPAVAFAEPNVDKWTALDDFADRISADVYDDGLRTWHIVDRPNALGTPVLELSTGPGGTVTTYNRGTRRGDVWANRVLLRYEWTDTGGTDHTIVSVKDASGPYAPAVGNVRTLRVERDTPTTQAQADLAAQALVDRAVTRGASLTLEAPSAYWLRPGHTITATLGDRDPEDLLVSAVRFNLRTGLMSITTRQPE